jgi:glycosyltransferase involved in cell wall biosynthesis
MIIGIDISSLPFGTGVSNYTINLVKHLVKNSGNNQFKLFFSSLRQPLPSDITQLLSHPNVKLYRYFFPPTFFEIIWNRLHILPIELFIGKCDIFHTWDWTQPPAIRAKLVTTIHDFVPILYPETQHPRTVSNFKLKLRWATAECSLFICVSKNTSEDLIRLFPQVEANKVAVILEAGEEKYNHFYLLPKLEKINKIAHFKKQYDLNHYVLAQGTREPRKNLDRLIKAFIKYKKHFPTSKIELAITGKYGWGKDVDRLKHPSIKILGYVPEKDMVALHAGATCLAYPSLYEGFGLPILKSISVGVPVITSNISSLPEVVGNSALLVNPKSTRSIYLALRKLLRHPEVRRKLTISGRAQSKKFSWNKTATETLLTYEKLLRKP